MGRQRVKAVKKYIFFKFLDYIDSFKIVFVKDTFKRENLFFKRHFLIKIFIFFKIVFSKHNF